LREVSPLKRFKLAKLKERVFQHFFNSDANKLLRNETTQKSPPIVKQIDNPQKFDTLCKLTYEKNVPKKKFVLLQFLKTHQIANKVTTLEREYRANVSPE